MIDKSNMSKHLRTEYLVINSANRRKDPLYRFGKIIILPERSVSILSSPSGDSTILLVKYSPEMAGVELNDSLVLDNLVGGASVLSNPFSVRKNSIYLCVNHNNHKQNEGSQDSLNLRFENIGRIFGSSNADDYYIMVNPKNQVRVQITAPSGLSQLGLSQQWFQESRRAFLIYTLIDGNYHLDHNRYLIRLDNPAINNYPDNSIDYSSTYGSAVTVRFNSFYGLTMDSDSWSIGLDSSLVVTATKEDSFIIETKVWSNIRTPLMVEEQIIFKKILSIEPAYPNANSWIETLPRRFNNVEKIQVVSSIFPNSQRLIENHNNELSWQVNDETYHTRIFPGNYSPEELAFQISSSMKELTPNINYKVKIDPVTCQITFAASQKSRDFVSDIVPDRIDPGDATYRMETMTKNGNIWRLYHEGRLEMDRAIVINWSGEILASANAPLFRTFSYNNYLMLLQWPDWRLRTNDLIVTDQFYDTSAVTQKYIYRVVNTDRSDDLIQLEPIEDVTVICGDKKYHSDRLPIDVILQPISKINSPYLDIFPSIGELTGIRGLRKIRLTDHNGLSQSASIIKIDSTYLRLKMTSPMTITEIELPLKMRLLMKRNSILKTLGFTSITDYSYRVNWTFAGLRLSGEDCMYLLSNKLSTISTYGDLRNIFQIINWHHPPGNVCYDCHTPMIKNFTPTTDLETIDFTAVNPDGSPYQFNGFDYQLVIEVQYR
jgi:hypothetical protein